MKLTLKQSKWVKETVRTLNPTEAARRTYKTKNNDVAKSIASENLTKPYLKRAIEQELNALGLDEQKIAEVHKRNIEQTENISASNTALDMYYKLRGDYAPEKKANLNLDVSTEQDFDREIQKVLEELRGLEAN